MPPWDAPAVADWDFPRSATGIAVLVEVGGRLGVDAGRVLGGTGLLRADLSAPHLLVTPEQEIAAIRNLRAAVPDGTPLAAEIGAAYRVTTFGILGYALLSSPTLREAIALTLRFIDLSYAFTTPEVELTGDQVVIRLADESLPADLRALLVDRDLLAVHTILAELVPGGLPFTRVALRGGRPPAVLARYAERLGTTPVAAVGGEGNTATFSATHLERPLPQGSPAAVAVAESMCRELVTARRGRGPVSTRVRVEITRNLSHGASMGAVASAIGMSPRTLRRHLSGEDTSYQCLLDEVRLGLATRMLGTGMLSVEDVAQRLGYAESSSFIHAFRRLTGRTPHQAAAASRPARGVRTSRRTGGDRGVE